MVGRPPKVTVAQDKTKLLDELRADLENYQASKARDAEERRLGRKLTPAERKAFEAKDP